MTKARSARSLRVVDGLELPEPYRSVLQPGGILRDRHDRGRRLPRFFYEVDSWPTALETQLTPNFSLWEFLAADVREAEPLRSFPRYVPCAVALLAAQLELFRSAAGALVHIAANGGYRSPAHALSREASLHCWGCAVNVYRVGDEFMDSQETIERYNRMALDASPTLWVRPFGHGHGQVDDHVHLEIGYVTLVPRGSPSENGHREEEERES
jgi:hypothetical protein